MGAARPDVDPTCRASPPAAPCHLRRRRGREAPRRASDAFADREMAFQRLPNLNTPKVAHMPAGRRKAVSIENLPTLSTAKEGSVNGRHPPRRHRRLRGGRVFV